MAMGFYETDPNIDPGDRFDFLHDYEDEVLVRNRSRQRRRHSDPTAAMQRKRVDKERSKARRAWRGVRS